MEPEQIEVVIHLDEKAMAERISESTCQLVAAGMDWDGVIKPLDDLSHALGRRFLAASC